MSWPCISDIGALWNIFVNRIQSCRWYRWRDSPDYVRNELSSLIVINNGRFLHAGLCKYFLKTLVIFKIHFHLCLVLHQCTHATVADIELFILHNTLYTISDFMKETSIHQILENYAQQNILDPCLKQFMLFRLFITFLACLHITNIIKRAWNKANDKMWSQSCYIIPIFWCVLSISLTTVMYQSQLDKSQKIILYIFPLA